MLDALNHFDHFVMSTMSDWTQYSALLNKFIITFLDQFTIKTLPVFAAIWLLWFSADAIKYRPAIVDGFVGMFVAGAVSRILQDGLRRPLQWTAAHQLPRCFVSDQDRAAVQYVAKGHEEASLGFRSLLD